MTVTPTAEQRALAEEIARGRNDRKIGRVRNRRVSKRHGDVEINREGALAEIVVAAALGVGVSRHYSLRGDSGVDLVLRDGRTVQVKYNHHAIGALYCSDASWARPTAEIMVLVVPDGDDGALRIAGWITVRDFYAIAHALTWGHGPCHGVHQHELERIETLRDAPVAA